MAYPGWSRRGRDLVPPAHARGAGTVIAGREVHVVFDKTGRILALADAGEVSGPGGVTLHHEPVAGPGQRSCRLRLTETHLTDGLAALIRDFEVDPTAAAPVLRRRGG